MTVKEISEFLKSNNAPPELVSFAETLKPVNIETVKEYLTANEEGKKFLQSYSDEKVTKALKTFEEKTLPLRVDEEMKKRHPEETPAEKALRKTEERVAQLERDLKRKELHNLAIKYATEKDIPTKHLERFLGEDEESTLKLLSEYEETYAEGVQKKTEKLFKAGGRQAPQSPATGKGADLDLEKISKMSKEELAKNEPLINQFTKSQTT